MLVGNSCQAVMQMRPMRCINSVWNMLVVREREWKLVDSDPTSCTCTAHSLEKTCCGGWLPATRAEAIGYYRGCQAASKPKPRVVRRSKLLAATYI